MKVISNTGITEIYYYKYLFNYSGDSLVFLFVDKSNSFNSSFIPQYSSTSISHVFSFDNLQIPQGFYYTTLSSTTTNNLYSEYYKVI